MVQSYTVRVQTKKRAPRGPGEKSAASSGTPPPRSFGQMLYAASPWYVVSRPSRSSSSATRRPTIRSATLNAMNATTAVQTNTNPTALAWMMNWSRMPGYSVGFIVTQLVMPGPPRLGALKIPVSSAPVIPPTACTPNTSSASSWLISFFRLVTPHRQIGPTASPITKAPGMPTLPAAGVIATSPATAPDAAPSIEGLPLTIHSANDQDSTAQAVARKVFMKARAAMPLASRAEPALKPNQPNHRSDAPIIVIVRLCGGIGSLPSPMRLPSRIAPTSPATPELMCTTVPPA